jgi:hypothetical protein
LNTFGSLIHGHSGVLEQPQSNDASSWESTS